MASIEHRSGRCRVKYRDPIGRQRSRTFTRKRTPTATPSRWKRTSPEASGSTRPGRSSLPVAEWAETFLSLCRRLEYTSRATYERDLRRDVLPRFGAYRIGSVPAEEIENWLNDELDAGIAPSSVHRRCRTLRRMFQVAIDKQKIVANPCDRVTPPRVPKKEMVFLDWDQVIELATAHSDRFQTLILFAVETGMRWSELVGLRQGRLDLRTGRVRVTEQLIRTEDREWIRKGPKTDAGFRSISLSPALVEAVRGHVRTFSGDGAEGLVFPSSRGTPLISSSFRTSHFGAARQAAGLACRFHDLRHTSVALAIAAGAHPKAIQTRMGHCRSPSPSTATATCSRSWTRRLLARSATSASPPSRGTRSGW